MRTLMSRFWLFFLQAIFLYVKLFSVFIYVASASARNYRFHDNIISLNTCIYETT